MRPDKRLLPVSFPVVKVNDGGRGVSVTEVGSGSIAENNLGNRPVMFAFSLSGHNALQFSWNGSGNLTLYQLHNCSSPMQSCDEQRREKDKAVIWHGSYARASHLAVARNRADRFRRAGAAAAETKGREAFKPLTLATKARHVAPFTAGL